ncbi:hypothetical protein M5X17_05035 [Paenibacillus alvei]|uniref:hypothetical protein n=1 Tax=Paenibacillus alvei TaxID=44250 RepID=UPI00228170B2|nr:hypothetical protein [Paenibacillus alvei]MCY9733124.1 hypothetical protein [Paenibacillus alvei]
MNQQALIESKALRESVINHTEVLNKVKKLTMLPGDLNINIEMAAAYYEVSSKTVESLIYDNREELESDGLQVLTGSALSSFKKESQIKSRAASITIIPRRAILRIGMLLRDSEVAKQVRTYLLNVEEVARDEQPQVVDKAVKHLELEVKSKRADAMLKNANTRQANLVMQLLDRFSSDLSSTARHSLIAVATNTVAGEYAVPLPATPKQYTATEIGEELGISKNMVGKIANRLGIKTPEYGMEVLDKSPYSSKQVPAFRYYESGRQAIINAHRKGV